MERRRVIRFLAIALVLHLAAGMLHGAPHNLASVDLQDWQWVYIAVVTNLLPITGFLLVWRYGRPRPGGTLFAASMAAAFLFGVTLHFLLPNPDHIHSVTSAWSLPFAVTAVLVAATDLLGVDAGGLVVYREN